MLDKDLLKTWFRSRAKPTQSQFYAWIDNLFFKGDKLLQEDVEGLEDTVNSLQLSINSLIPNQIISGGEVTTGPYVVGGDTDLSKVVVSIPATEYKLKGVPFSCEATDIVVSRPTGDTIKRIDVPYLNETGFHILSGTPSNTPVKPQLSAGFELTNILIAKDNVILGPSFPLTPSLQQVTLAGNKTSKPLISKDSLQAGQAATNITGAIKATGLTANRQYLLPDADGVFALISDLESIHINESTITIDALTSFAALETNDAIETIVVKGNLGGTFHRYTGASAANGGTIFTDASAVKWKRKISDHINVEWFMGASATADAPFAAAYAAATNPENLNFARIYFPKREGAWYAFTSSIIINTKVDLYGDGTDSVLKFGAGASGIILNYITTRFSKVHDIVIEGTSNGYSVATPHFSDYSTTVHGFIPKDIVFATNITVRYFTGNGFYLVGNSTDPTHPSNVNNCRFVQCIATQNRLHGYYIQGADANAIEFQKCDAISNGGCGFKDDSFLGNHYRTLHSASNGSPEIPWQRGLVSYLGNTYACIVDGTIGVLPTDTTKWQLNPTNWNGFPSVLAYDATVTYYAVGAWFLTGTNQYGTMISCYSEYDQAPSFAQQRNTLFGVSAMWLGKQANLTANSGMLWTANLYGGNPSDADQLPFISKVDGLGVKYGSSKFAWKMTDNSKIFLEGSALAAFYYSAVPPAGRINAIGGMVSITYGFLSGTVQDRTKLIRVDISRSKPTVTTYDLGDIVLNGGNVQYFDDRPEVVLFKKVGTTGASTVQWNKVVGFTEYSFTTSNNSLYTLFEDLVGYNMGQYELVILARDSATGDMYTERRVLTFGCIGNVYPQTIKQSLSTQIFSDTSMTGVIIGMDQRAGGSTLRLYANGITGMTINWTIRVNRILAV